LLDSFEPTNLEEEESEALPPSVVQFSTAQFFCTEEEGNAQVDIVRLGEANGTAFCTWRTEDGSAKAGERFVAQSGEVEFGPGETMKNISIPLIASSSWDSTLEFSVVLAKVSKARRGQYLNRCLVSIIDNDAFPTNKYASEALDKDRLAEVQGLSLLFEYVRMNLSDRNARNKTFIFMLMDQISNLYFLLTVYLQMYLVDVVLGGEEEGEEGGERRLLRDGIHAGGHFLARMLQEEEEFGGLEFEEPSEENNRLLVPGSRRYTAVVVGLLYIIPFTVTHVISILKIKTRLGGTLRKVLQTALMRKYLTFREDVASSVSAGDVSMAMTRDVTEVVNFGYMKLLALSCVMGRLGYAMIFILNENTMAALPLSLFLVIGGIFLCCRESTMVESSEEVARAENNLVHYVHDVIANQRLVTDFQLRPFVISRYERSINIFNQRKMDSILILTNNGYCPEWITTLLLGGYMVYGTSQVKSLGGPLSLGAFLATLNIFKEVGKEMAEIYMEVMEILKVAGALRTVTYFMNQPTFMNQMLQRNRKRRVQGKERRLAAREGFQGTAGVARTDDGKFVFAVDTIKIELDNVSFSYGPKPFLDKVSLELAQGQLIAFLGVEQSGKATLLRLIAGVFMPKDGDAFVPAHMRVLHIARESLILNGSLLSNIIFDKKPKDVGGLDRVRRICTRCGFTQEALGLLVEEDRETEGSEDGTNAASWSHRFSSSDLARLNLVRGLVMNPECMVMHMPLLSFGDSEAKKLFDLLRVHIDERGLELSEVGRKYRRPRTVIFSSYNFDRCSRADAIYEVTSDQKVKEYHAHGRSW